MAAAAYLPKAHQTMMAAGLRQAFQQPDQAAAWAVLHYLADQSIGFIVLTDSLRVPGRGARGKPVGLARRKFVPKQLKPELEEHWRKRR